MPPIKRRVVVVGGDVGDGDDGGERKKMKKEWTPAEDAILVERVERHWKGSWKSLQEETRLPHSSKACRLRWINHHRPGQKTAEFTPEEETLIRSLLDELGQNWTGIAKRFPGRTDNEVKGFWYRNLRPRLRGPRRPPLQPQTVVQFDPITLPSRGDFNFIPLPGYSSLNFQSSTSAGMVLGFPVAPSTSTLLPAWSSLPCMVQPLTPPGLVDSPLLSAWPSLPCMEQPPATPGLAESPLQPAWSSLPCMMQPATPPGLVESPLFPAWSSLPFMEQPPGPPRLAESPQLPPLQITPSAIGGIDEVIDDGSSSSSLSAILPPPPSSSTSLPQAPQPEPEALEWNDEEEFCSDILAGEDEDTGGSGREKSSPASQLAVDDSFSVDEYLDPNWDESPVVLPSSISEAEQSSAPMVPEPSGCWNDEIDAAYCWTPMDCSEEDFVIGDLW